MMKHYPWLWFDADNTLFDYNRAESTALRNTFQLYNLPVDDASMATYREINQKLWHALEKGEIKPDVLRVKRFEQFLHAVGRDASPESMSNSYIEQLAQRTELIDGTLEVLQKLKATRRFALITNGLTTVQRGRLSLSPLKEFFEVVVISEEIGAAKPHSAFFEVAHERSGHPPKSDVLVIGDSLSSDIRGGVDFGVDTCWFNPHGESLPDGLAVTYEIRSLRELL
jgi:2-haloacid dehalogenase